MKPNTFAGAFILACAVIAAVALVGYDPEPPRMSGSSSTALPPRAWPDYSVNGPGFTAPDMTDGGLIAYGYQLVARTFGAIDPRSPIQRCVSPATTSPARTAISTAAPTVPACRWSACSRSIRSSWRAI
jgi:hypothetical protein